MMDGHYWGHIEFQDQLRNETPQAISKLRDCGVQTIMMLTGDQDRIAQRIASKIGITQVFA